VLCSSELDMVTDGGKERDLVDEEQIASESQVLVGG
jgi:hypothetical protein